MPGLWNSFSAPPPQAGQRQYLEFALEWGAQHSQGFESHWSYCHEGLQSGRVFISPKLFRGGEGLYNALNGRLYLSSERLPLKSEQCLWALGHRLNPVVVQGLVDVTAVIVHETTHALAGFWGSLKEGPPYRRERDYLRQLALHPDLHQRAQSRLKDLLRDAWECEKIRLEED